MLTRNFKDVSPFVNRRAKLNQLTGDAVFILFSGEEGHLAQYRSASHFIYLTGFEEPSSVVVIRTGQEPRTTLFVRDKDSAVETWDGERHGPELAKVEFQMDDCFSNAELEVRLPQLLTGAERIYFALGDDAIQDDIIIQARAAAQQLQRRSGQPKIPIFDPNEVLGPMRMVKDDFEISLLKESCDLSARAHINVMKNVKPGMNERQALAHLLFSFYSEKATKEGYSSIVASGSNACTLHYRANTRDMEDGDFLLVDAGAEKNYFTADITRTYPINGKFTEAQKAIYSAVLEVQKKLIAMVKPGMSLPELHEHSVKLLTKKMIDLKLLAGTVEENVESKAYHKYYPHGVGHYLGMDVHDVGISKKGDQPVPLQAGMVITVEPGIYVPEDDESAPQELRGLGVRIEDDVLVTTSGHEVLTSLVPKEVEELEQIINS